MRPNCALDRHTILCLDVPGFQKLIFKGVPKFKWIPPTKLPWILRTYEGNVYLVGTFVRKILVVLDSATVS